MTVQYEYAFDNRSNLIHVDDAILGNSYVCPECGQPLRAKNRGMIKAHHFYHLNGDVDHSGSSGESPIHFNSKGFVYNKLKSAIEQGNLIDGGYTLLDDINCNVQVYDNHGKPLHIKKEKYAKIPVNCYSYSSIFDFDSLVSPVKHTLIKHAPSAHIYIPSTGCPDFMFIKNTDQVLIEKKTDGYVPDISLMRNGKLVTAIEIVHTHMDSLEKQLHYFKNGINVVYIDVSTIQNYEKLMSVKRYFPPDICKVVVNRGCEYALITTTEMLIQNIDLAENAKTENNMREEAIKIEKARKEKEAYYASVSSCFNYLSHVQAMIDAETEYLKAQSHIDSLIQSIYKHTPSATTTAAGLARHYMQGSFFKNRYEILSLINSGAIYSDGEYWRARIGRR